MKPLLINRVQQQSSDTAFGATLQLSYVRCQGEASPVSATVQSKALSALTSQIVPGTASISARASTKVTQNALPTSELVQHKSHRLPFSLAVSVTQYSLDTDKSTFSSNTYLVRNAVKIWRIELSHKESGQVLRYYANLAGASSYFELKYVNSIMECLEINQTFFYLVLSCDTPRKMKYTVSIPTVVY